MFFLFKKVVSRCGLCSSLTVPCLGLYAFFFKIWSWFSGGWCFVPLLFFQHHFNCVGSSSFRFWDPDNSFVNILVINFQKNEGHVIGWKFNSKLPFSLSFTQSNASPVNIHFGTSFSSKHLSNCIFIVLYRTYKFLSSIPNILGFSCRLTCLSFILKLPKF